MNSHAPHSDESSSNRKSHDEKKWVLLFATLAATSHAEDTLKKMKDTGVAVMGVRESSGALSYALGNGSYGGYHVELCQRILAEAEKQLGRKLEIKYHMVTAQNRIPSVQNSTVDIECGSTTNTANRQKDVAFAVTSYVEEVRIAVKADSSISSINQLDGKTVTTSAGSTSVQLLRKHERATGIDFKEIFAKDNAENLIFLESGKADAWVLDVQIMAGNIARHKTPHDFKIVGEVLSVEPIAIALRKDDPSFKQLVDDTLKGLMKSGEIAKIYDKWFVQPIPPTGVKLGLPASAATKAAWASPNDNPVESYVKK